MITEKKKLPPMLARLKKKGKLKLKKEDIEKYATKAEKLALKEDFADEHGISDGEQEAGEGNLSVVTIKLLIDKEDVDDLLGTLSDLFGDTDTLPYLSLHVLKMESRDANPEDTEDTEEIEEIGE